MTPGAWKKGGATYSLADEPKPEQVQPPPEPSEATRRERLRNLFHALAAHAVSHEGRYPPPNDTAIAAHLWKTPHNSTAPYIYLSGRTTADPGRVLACEPEVFREWRLVLFTNGDVRRMTSEELAPLLSPGPK